MVRPQLGPEPIDRRLSVLFPASLMAWVKEEAAKKKITAAEFIRRCVMKEKKNK